MVRETRHLWVGNLPENIREDRIREQFKRYGRVQSVKLLPRVAKEETGEISMACTVAFMDIKSASKAHNSELKIDDRTLNTEYYEPAAIPSAASPQNTPSPYSTSPGSTRFPNGHGSSDEHGAPFTDRFYERTNSRVSADGEFIRRSAGYPENARGRIRDRSFRNGPYATSLIDRHRALNSAWTGGGVGGYPAEAGGGGRYIGAGSGQTAGQTETGYVAPPAADGVERRNSDAAVKKKTKSRSGSRTPSPSGSTSSRSPTRSRSRSSSSSSSSTTSRATSSTSSPKSRRQANANHQQVVHSDDKRPLAICVKNLPLRSSDTSLKDGLFHEYKKHGKVTWVKVVGQNADRHAIVCFKKPEDVDKAIEVSYDKLFFGHKIEVAPYQGYDVDDNDQRPYEADLDEFHPKATRTLFIGNLEKDITASDLRKIFDQFGEIIEIDIKKQGTHTSYAFCQYSDIISVVKAIRKMDGEHVGLNRAKLGFGKSMPTNCVWVDGVAENVNEKYLKMQFDQFGVISKVHVDREKSQALVFYEQVVSAQTAVNKMRGFTLKSNKIQVDFASRECQESFFEHLEKQGAVLERTAVFEERRDSTSRSFDSTTNRYSRYDTPTRPRTSSYSSRSSATASQLTSAIPSPGTPGSATPRGTGSRARLARFPSEYYDVNAEYPESRPFRTYDEYSQGSPASHDDYEAEYYIHSPTHVEVVESRSLQSVDAAVPFHQPADIRNLQKERVHLLEQLEECPSSGDELISPKKRLKLDLENSVSEVIIEANRDHRKVMEVRRLSDANLKHHSRRPSIDSGKHIRDVGGHDRTSYLPHAVCKRRKTGGSDSSSRVHQYDHSGSESVGGSRPGTPLCDERPENFPPTEPRRIPREREGPLSLPLPRFAAQVMNRGRVSVAGIKGQDNVLSSPPPAVTSPRIPRPPSPIQYVPPPASPPPRPPSLSSNSSDSGGTSPSLEERIKDLDVRYEAWSGSRVIHSVRNASEAPPPVESKFRIKSSVLDADVNSVPPSDIVKVVLAKRSVFDEDLKRLENVGEKYEPKEFGTFPKVATSTPTTIVSSSVPALQLSIQPTLKLATATQATMLSPRSSGTTIPAAKGLQYPFPSHPPMQPAPLTPTTVACSLGGATVLATTSPGPAAPSSTSIRAGPVSAHGDNRLKPCEPATAPAASDNTRTCSKVSVNRCASLASSAAKTASEKTTVNIPGAVEASVGDGKHAKNKASDKVSCRRDSNSSGSPRADVKTRRNSDTSARKLDDKLNSDVSDNQKERARSEERKKEQRLEKVRLENERLEKEKAEKERIEKERIEKEKQEKERLEKEKLEKERLERESELEKERLQKERIEKEKLEKERLEQERLENERRKEKEERERKEREERERKDQEERERKEREEKERREKEEQLEKEKLEKERIEKERRERERKEKEERDRKEQERREREKEERARKEQEEKERREAKERKEREEREKREEQERLDKERLDKERLEKERPEKERTKRDEDRRHKDDNHDKRKDEHRHRENHSEKSDNKHSSDKHRDNNVDKHFYEKNTKESKEDKKDNHENCRRDVHESRSSHDKSRHHIRDDERRKESIKENRDNNIHDKHKNFSSEIKESKDKPMIESRHMSIDIDKKSFDNSLFGKDPTKRKERNNSLPANLGKRRMSSHDSLECPDEHKRMKLEHKKLSERRDSKDSTRSDDKIKSKHKNNSLKHEKHNNTKDSDEKRKEKEREERHKSKHKLEKQKIKSKSREKESRESPTTPKSPLTDKDFLARLDLRATDEIQRKELKEKRKDSTEEEKRDKDDKKVEERFKKEKQLQHQSSREIDKSSKIREDPTTPKTSEERKAQKKEMRIRKMTNSSETDTDDDEPKKHSIFDIVDDEPAYISMYDKVKARSCKNMQKQEQEKRQEKIKAKFSQLKQSRAKREEKKRSTSWDEDSDSERDRMDKGEFKHKRPSKMCIVSSDDEERHGNKNRMDSGSDSDMHKHNKFEQISDDERIRTKNSHFKSCKSRITSDTSDDEFRKSKEATDMFSDDQDFADSESKPFSNEIERIKEMKKERRNSKHQETTEITSQIYTGSSSPMLPDKDKLRTSFPENTSDEEIMEIKKERADRKKHKKKQKRQKHSISSEDLSKTDAAPDSIHNDSSEKSKHHDKKRQHSKKDKKRDKSKDERDKTKKSKKKSESKSENKSGKVENLFGSLSEDSENGAKESKENIEQPKNSFHGKFLEETAPSVYNSESEHENKSKLQEEKEREHKRRKEKKRREKQERRLQEAAAAQQSNENSMDFADMGKQLEANIKDESVEETEVIKNEMESLENNEDSFAFSEAPDVKDSLKEERKKKKRKKSKEEKQKHHHHHHHDKNKIKSPEFKKEQPEFKKEEIKTESEYKNEFKPEFKNESTPTPEIKIEVEEPKTQSMPSITDFSPENKISPNKLDFSISPINREPLISPIPKTPTTSKDKKRDKLILGFGVAMDENLHESAIKSISEFEPVKQESPLKDEEIKTENITESSEEKPRVVISQEETEDAVAALLGESFGIGEQFKECYTEEITSITNEQSQTNEENNAQDDEEMRQAVQSLSTSDLDAKPDTPQSEHELQIDTDTEEQEDISLRFDQPPKTPDISELLVPPKTPDIPSYFRNTESKVPVSPVIIKTSGIGSPPSLTPISKPTPLVVAEIKKKPEVESHKSLPMLPEQQRPLISQPEKPAPAVFKPESPKVEVKPDTPQAPVIVSQSQPKQIVAVTSAPLRTYSTPPMVKITEPSYPPLTALSKTDQKSPTIEQKKILVPVLQLTQQKSPSTLHNLPARPPVQIKSSQDSTLMVPKSNPSRLPITSVMVSKPLQPNKIILPQAKTAHSLEPPKLISTCEPRPQEIPKMVFQTSTIQSTQYPYVCTPTRMVVPASTIQSIRNIPPGLLVPTRPPNSYSYTNSTPSIYTMQTVAKEKVVEKIPPETLRLTPISTAPIATTYQNNSQQPITSVYMSTASSVTKPFMNVIHETPAATKPIVSQPSIIKSTASQQQTLPDPSKTLEINENPVKVIIENLRSTPSPVIVVTPKETLPEVVKPQPKPESPKPEEKSDTVGKVLENMETISDELNLTLKKESQKETKEVPEEKPKEVEKLEPLAEVTTEKPNKQEDKPEEKPQEIADKIKQDTDNSSVIKEIEKFDEEKADTESVVSDISKERSSADILSKDDPLDTKEDSDYWSAKEVNIDSVIKTLCSADELSDHSSDVGKDEWEDEAKANDSLKSETSEKLDSPEKKDELEIKSEEDAIDEGVENEEKEPTIRTTRGRGGRGRGRRGRGATSDRGGIQTRRGGKIAKEPVITTTIVTAKRGGRGGRPKNERKVHKSESDTAVTDVYEFRDDADESSKEQRPRLILTIKSPAVSAGGNTQTAIVKEVTKDGAKEISKEISKEIVPTKQTDKEEFASPVSNTRKSRRLQERDVSRNTVDDTIEDVVKNTIQTRASANQNLVGGTRRSTRQVIPKQPLPETPRKSPRGGRRNQRRASEANDDSDAEKSKEPEPTSTVSTTPETPKQELDKSKESPKIEQKKQEPPAKEIPHVGVKAEMLRRLNREQNHEPTNLIDPVTGLLTPMRECEEGKYIPLPGSMERKQNAINAQHLQQVQQAQLPIKTSAEVKQPSVITPAQQVTVVQQPKPQSFKAHVLASQAAKAVVSQQQMPIKAATTQAAQQPQAMVVTKTTAHSQPPVVVVNAIPQPITVTKTTSQPVRPAHQLINKIQPVNKIPVSQNLNVNVSMAMNMTPSHLSPRTNIIKVKPPSISPNQVVLNQQQMLQVSKQQQVQLTKAHLTTAMSNQQVVNTQLAHMKHHQNVTQQLTKQQQQVLMNKGKPVHPMHQQIIANAVGSPPLSKSQQLANTTRIIQGPMSGAKGVMEPPKVEVGLANIGLGPRSTLSPQGQARHIAVPGFESALHGVRRSPPPAHQNSPSPQGEQIAHFPPGPIRSIHDIPPYMHSHAMQYQQFLRQQSYHLPRSPMMPGNVEKSDGQEGEEAPVTSPPLELRRTASVGLPLTGRSTTVPHSLHSPHDRATDSPQVGQVYNMHSARMQHYPPSHPSRYFDQTAEPPPAHRPMTSHTLAALGSDRPLHMTSLGNPDRPLSSHIPPERPISAHVVPDRPQSSHLPPDRLLSGHIPPERPISSHLVPERPLSGHIPPDRTALSETAHLMGAGLGAAGNLLGAVVRHHGADAPTSQRGLQAATPPHASQVPPQAESLFMLLKQYPCMWQGLLALKNDQAAVQMYFVSGNATVAKDCLPENTDGTTPPLRIFQRMRLEPPQVEGVSRKMQMQNEHCMLLALPCGHDHMDVLKQSTNLTTGFIKYLQAKQAAGIVNVAAPGTTHPPAYVVHIFPSCEFVNENLRRIAPNLLERVADIAHLLIVVTTV